MHEKLEKSHFVHLSYFYEFIFTLSLTVKLFTFVVIHHQNRPISSLGIFLFDKIVQIYFLFISNIDLKNLKNEGNLHF